jgi:hypothetical protein
MLGSIRIRNNACIINKNRTFLHYVFITHKRKAHFIIVQDDLVLKPEQPGGGRRVGSGRILAREGGAAPRPEEFSLKPTR